MICYSELTLSIIFACLGASLGFIIFAYRNLRQRLLTTLKEADNQQIRYKSIGEDLTTLQLENDKLKKTIEQNSEFKYMLTDLLSSNKESFLKIERVSPENIYIHNSEV